MGKYHVKASEDNKFGYALDLCADSLWTAIKFIWKARPCKNWSVEYTEDIPEKKDEQIL